MSGESDKAKPLTRKPSFKNRKPPEVKQTLTSKYRLLKANPLLVKAIVDEREDKEKLFLDKSLKTLANALGKSTEILNPQLPIQTLPKPRESVAPTPRDAKPKIQVYPKKKNSFNCMNSCKIDFTADHFLSSTVIEKRRESLLKTSLKQNGNNFDKSNSNGKLFANSKPTGSKLMVNGSNGRSSMPTLTRVNGTNNKFSMPNKHSSTLTKPKNIAQQTTMNKTNQQNQKKIEKPKPLRRSLSAQHFDKKKKEEVERLRSCNALPQRSQSSEELKSKKLEEKQSEEHKLNFSTITEESSFDTAPSTPAPQFKTPMANIRKSIMTPNTTNNRRSLFLSTPASEEMSKRLNDWLKKRGKSLGEFHHLKCFGIHDKAKIVDEENKENVQATTNDSYEELRIIPPHQPTQCKTVGFVDLQSVAKEALQDLHKLILEGYPSDQCECWLRLIKQKYKELEEDPQYWECRAALEQSKGNINLAVECYKTAIVQGAEVQAVDESLDQLLQKFSLLNINSKEGKAKDTKDRARIVQDARNIFKSSIIQFAVQERILKKKSKEGMTIEKKLIATPVRRSTRLNRSAYTSTPGVKIYSSLHEMDNELKSTIDFRHNKALND